MSSPDFTIKQNDTKPIVQATLTNADLANASQVEFHMRKRARAGSPVNTNVAVEGAAVIEDAGLGEVSYTWAEGDTDTCGDFEVEWQVTYTDGSILTFPNDDTYGIIRVYEELG